MRSVTTLSDGAVGVGGSVGVDRVGAVVLLIGLAVIASQIRLNLRADTDSVCWVPSALSEKLWMISA